MKQIILSAFIISSMLSNAQNPIKPGSYEMSLSSVDGGLNEVGALRIEIKNLENNTVGVFSTLHFRNSNEVAIDTCIADATTFQPIYRSSFHGNFNLVLHYGKEITGYYLDKKTGEKAVIEDHITEPFVDNIFYQYFITTLPMATGYKKSVNVYDYKPGNRSSIKKLQITEVKNNLYSSPYSGDRNAWEATITEENSNNTYVYYIDKNTQRIWRIDAKVGGTNFRLIDKESDYNPYQTRFDKDATLKLVRDGNSVISGQAFARDHVAGAKSIAIMNVKKKQNAGKGTIVTLIPYTDFFKEWVNLCFAADKGHKQRPPLPKGAEECIKTTTVYDNDGHFEFPNLMPGDYLLVAQITYVHAWVSSQVVGYTDTYIGGAYQGTTANTVQHNGASLAGDEARTIVTIKTDGEKVDNVKLKSWK